jgi:hypothetical protein
VSDDRHLTSSTDSNLRFAAREKRGSSDGIGSNSTAWDSEGAAGEGRGSRNDEGGNSELHCTASSPVVTGFVIMTYDK